MSKLLNTIQRWFSTRETKRILNNIKDDKIPLSESNDPNMKEFFKNNYDRGELRNIQ